MPAFCAPPHQPDARAKTRLTRAPPPPAQIPNPLQAQFTDAAARLRGVAVAWAGSLAGTVIPAEDLMLALVSPEAFWLLREWRRSAFGELELLRDILDGTKQQISARSKVAGSPLKGATVTVRSKGLWSTFHKADVRRKSVHDALAVRVVLRDDADLYAALEEIRSLYPSMAGRFKDYVLFPKANGYTALHDTLLLPCGRLFEIQLRTATMHREVRPPPPASRRRATPANRLDEAPSLDSLWIPSSFRLAKPFAHRAASAALPSIAGRVR